MKQLHRSLCIHTSIKLERNLRNKKWSNKTSKMLLQLRTIYPATSHFYEVGTTASRGFIQIWLQRFEI